MPCIDVSHWQGDIRWGECAAAGVKKAFIKTSDGDSFIDGQFWRNVRGCREHDIKVGLYHYWRPEVRAEDQAKHYCRLYQDVEPEPELGAVLDLEQRSDAGNIKNIVSAYTWLLMAERILRQKPMIYSSLYFIRDCMAINSGHPGPCWLSEYPLWIAQYGDMHTPNLPHAWAERGYSYWQYTDSGTIPGIDGSVDLNHERVAR